MMMAPEARKIPRIWHSIVSRKPRERLKIYSNIEIHAPWKGRTQASLQIPHSAGAGLPGQTAHIAELMTAAIAQMG
jgi:hypothetical protein